MPAYFKRHFNKEEIPNSIRLITTVTSIRWFGWGFAETLIPVLIFSFGNSFAEAGLIKASVDITFMLALPVIGIFADRVRATTLIAIGAFLYLFVGFGYFLTGVTGMVGFMIAARLLNGVSWGLDVAGRETFLRRHADKGKMATVFGYFDTVANFWWVVAAIIGIFLLPFFSITELLFMIVPFSLISLWVVLAYRQKEERMDSVAAHQVPMNLWKEIKEWSVLLKGIVGFNFLIAFTGSVVVFFLPIQAYKEGGSLVPVVLMGVAYTLPLLAGWGLGELFDAKGYKILNTSLILLALLLLSLAFFTSFIWRIVIIFVISMILELISVGSNELLTASVHPDHFGRVEGVMRSVTSFGEMTGPIIVGILIDITNTGSAFISLAVLIFSVAILFKIIDKRGFIEKYSLITR